MNLKLVPSKPEYAEIFYKWRNEAHSKLHNPLMDLDLMALRKQLESQASHLHEIWQHESFRWFVEVDGVLVGQVSLKNINKMMLTAEIGYAIGEDHQGKGLATAAVRKLVKMVFEETSLRKLLALIHDKNLASQRVITKAGFVQEGHLREHFLINGVPANQLLYGLLRNEYFEFQICD